MLCNTEYGKVDNVISNLIIVAIITRYAPKLDITDAFSSILNMAISIIWTRDQPKTCSQSNKHV